MPFVASGLAKIRSASKRTEQSAAKVQAALPKVEDRTPWWASLLGKIALAALIVVAAFVLWRTGVLMLIRAGVTALVPQATRSAATLEVKGAPQEEVTAVLRTDPRYEAARKAAKKKQAEQAKESE